MGKWAAERRKKLFDELKANGKLDKPLYMSKKDMQEKAQIKPLVKAVAKPKSNCCLDKYKGNLPMNFRPCHGCPKGKGP